MKRSKYVRLLLVGIVLYMLYTSTLLLNQWRVDLSHHPVHFTLETKTTTQSSLAPRHQTLGLEDLDGILYDGQVAFVKTRQAVIII